MLLYLPVRQFLYHPDIGRYRTYGIAAFELCFARAKRLAFVPDVALCRKDAARLRQNARAASLRPLSFLTLLKIFSAGDFRAINTKQARPWRGAPVSAFLQNPRGTFVFVFPAPGVLQRNL